MSASLSSHNQAITDQEAWRLADEEDLWVFDKLIVARRSGHPCGSRGFQIPESGLYCVRPVTNFEGMGYGARIEHRNKGDWMMDIHPGDFWVKKFTGQHVSVDYVNGKQATTVAGYRNNANPLFKFDYWVRESYYLPLPGIFSAIAKKYEFINCEFIGGNLIEVHLRQNPDFVYGNKSMIPVWTEEQALKVPDGYTFIRDTAEEKRVGIFIST